MYRLHFAIYHNRRRTKNQLAGMLCAVICSAVPALPLAAARPIDAALGQPVKLSHWRCIESTWISLLRQFAGFYVSQDGCAINRKSHVLVVKTKVKQIGSETNPVLLLYVKLYGLADGV